MDIEKIKDIKFEVDKRGGYNTSEVDSFLSQIYDEFVEKEKQIILLANKLKEYREDENSLKTVLLNAQKLADSIVKEANQQAEKLLYDAKMKADTIISSIAIDQKKEQEKLNRIKNEVNDFKVLILKLYKKHIESISSIAINGISDVDIEEIIEKSQIIENNKSEETKEIENKQENITEEVKFSDKQDKLFQYKSNNEQNISEEDKDIFSKNSGSNKNFDFSNLSLEDEFTKI